MQLIEIKQGEPLCQPDPYVLKTKGKYYIYATSAQGVNVYSANALTGGYRYVGCVSFAGRKEYWAPCVYEEDGKYYMYVSTMADAETDVHCQAIGVAVSGSPDGGFHYQGEILPPFSIDPHLVKSGGELFLFYSVNDYDAERAGTYIVVDKMKDFFTPAGQPKAVVRPTLDEEIFMKDRFKQGQHWHTLEGAFYFRKGDFHYLMYSGNCYESPYYYVGYAVAETSEDDLTKIEFQKQPSQSEYKPVLRRNDAEEGTGHNSVLEENGVLYCVYHARTVGAEQKPYDTRTARICRLIADGKSLTAQKMTRE